MSGSQTQRDLIVETSDGWMTIWLNRPTLRNALSNDLIEELSDVLIGLRADRSVRGISLRGKGDVFCAGGDIKGFKVDFQGAGQSAAAIAKANRAAGELFKMLDTMPQVVVMLVHGAAIAGGLGMMCTGDVVAVTESTKFAVTETTIGLPPAQIAPLIVRRVGLATARRLMLTAARFNGEQAGELGFADFVVADVSGLDEFEAELKHSLKRCAPGAIATTKEIIHASLRLDRDAMIVLAADRFAQSILDDEGREGVASFIEKRKPNWAL